MMIETERLFFAFVSGVVGKEQPAQYDKPDDDADDGQPRSDLIHELPTHSYAKMFKKAVRRGRSERKPEAYSG